MKTETLPENWKKLFVEIYGEGSLRSYTGWTCIQCGNEFNAILQGGECPNCHYNSVLSNFFKKAINTVIKAADGKVTYPKG